MPEDEWLEPDDQMGLWEYQLHPLTIERLVQAVGELEGEGARAAVQSLLGALGPLAALPVEVVHYDGVDWHRLRPMHIDVRAEDGRAAGFVITVH